MLNANFFDWHDEMPKYTVDICSGGYVENKAPICVHQCTGTIISSRWIISAFHCVGIGIGSTVRFYSGRLLNGEVRNVIRVVDYPGASGRGFNSKFERRDLKLIQVDRPIDDKYRAAFVTLQQGDYPRLNGKSWIAGGGQHDGRDNPRAVLKWDTVRNAEFDGSTISVGNGLEPGDSGGPLMRWYDPRDHSRGMELIGVVSSVFTKTHLTYVGIPEIRSWIRSIVS